MVHQMKPPALHEHFQIPIKFLKSSIVKQVKEWKSFMFICQKKKQHMI